MKVAVMGVLSCVCLMEDRNDHSVRLFLKDGWYNQHLDLE